LVWSRYNTVKQARESISEHSGNYFEGSEFSLAVRVISNDMLNHFVSAPQNSQDSEAIGSLKVNFSAIFGDTLATWKGMSKPASDWKLELISTLPFRDKWTWFIKKTSCVIEPPENGKILIEVGRASLLEDTLKQLQLLDSKHLRKRFFVSFKNEPGIDGGGLQREWLVLSIKHLFSEEMGLFQVVDKQSQSFWINPTSSLHHDAHLDYFRLAGRLMGKALAEQIALPLFLSLPLLKHIIGAPLTMGDLEFFDQDLYAGLKSAYKCPNIEVPY
jgi:hypothetical protein